jgi:catechol-2,3-dioxygenase
MAAVGLSHYNIKAPLKQLEELRDFYCKIVGLVEGPRPPFKRFGYWLYANDQAILHLIAAQNDKDPDTTTSTTIDHVAFACTDFHEMKDKLASNGVSYSFAEVPKRNQRQLFLKDPAGNGVELIFELEPPPKNT